MSPAEEPKATVMSEDISVAPSPSRPETSSKTAEKSETTPAKPATSQADSGTARHDNSPLPSPDVEGLRERLTRQLEFYSAQAGGKSTTAVVATADLRALLDIAEDCGRMREVNEKMRAEFALTAKAARNAEARAERAEAEAAALRGALEAWGRVIATQDHEGGRRTRTLNLQALVEAEAFARSALNPESKTND